MRPPQHSTLYAAARVTGVRVQNRSGPIGDIDPLDPFPLGQQPEIGVALRGPARLDPFLKGQLAHFLPRPLELFGVQFQRVQGDGHSDGFTRGLRNRKRRSARGFLASALRCALLASSGGREAGRFDDGLEQLDVADQPAVGVAEALDEPLLQREGKGDLAALRVGHEIVVPLDGQLGDLSVGHDRIDDAPLGVAPFAGTQELAEVVFQGLANVGLELRQRSRARRATAFARGEMLHWASRSPRSTNRSVSSLASSFTLCQRRSRNRRKPPAVDSCTSGFWAGSATKSDLRRRRRRSNASIPPAGRWSA